MADITYIMHLSFSHTPLIPSLTLSILKITPLIDLLYLSSLLNNRQTSRAPLRMSMNASMVSINVSILFISFFLLVQEQSIISLVELLSILLLPHLTKTSIIISKISTRSLGHYKLHHMMLPSLQMVMSKNHMLQQWLLIFGLTILLLNNYKSNLLMSHLSKQNSWLFILALSMPWILMTSMTLLSSLIPFSQQGKFQNPKSIYSKAQLYWWHPLLNPTSARTSGTTFISGTVPAK